MAEVTGTIGNEIVELNNAATEATLKQLLSSLKTLNKSVLSIKSPAGGGGGGGDDAAPALAAVASKAGAAGAAFSAMSSIMTSLGGVIGKVMFATGVIAGAFVNLGEKALEGDAKMSDFYSAIQSAASTVPLIGGILGTVVGLFQKLAEFQERNLETYQKLTDVGVNFGGSLTNLRQAALNSYLTLDQFADIAKSSTDAFAKLGGSINTGAMMFGQLSNALQAGDVGAQLRSLGYTAVDINKGLASYIELTGYRSTAEMKTVKGQQAIINGSAEYLEQLDGLARITGKSRQQQEEDMKAASKNAAFQARLAAMDPEERKKALAGMAQAMAIGGKGAVDAFQSKLMGVAPDKAGAMFIATSGNLANVVDKSADMVMDGTKDVKDMGKLSKDMMRAAQQDFAKYGKEGLFAIIRQGGPAADALQHLGLTANRAASMSDEEIEKELARADLKDKEAALVAEANKAMQDLGQEIMKGLAPIIKELTPIMSKVVTQFVGFIKTVDFETLGKQIVSAFTTVVKWVSNIFTEAGQNKLLNDIKYFFQLALIEIKKALIPWYTDSRASRDTLKLEEEKKVADLRAEAAKELEGYNKLADDAAKSAALARIKSNIAEADAIEQRLAAGQLAPVASATYESSSVDQTFFRKGPAESEEEYKKRMEDYAARVNSAMPQRSTGSLGSTGKLFEDFGKGTPTMLHGNEAVVTPGQMSDIISSAQSVAAAPINTDNLADQLQRLNTLTTEMLKVMRESSEHMKKNVDATKALGRDLFAF